MTDWCPQPPPPPPSDLDVDELFRDLHWHQRWEIFSGVFTPGRNDVTTLCDYAGLPLDLRGRRILDVGAWHGCFSFECERRGASEVVALSPERCEHVGFDRIQQALGSRVVYREGSVYDLDPLELGRFDLVLFFGVLYHLRYPILAIDRLHAVCSGDLLVETHVMDNCLVPAGKTSDEALSLDEVNPCLRDIPLWQFYRRDELAHETSNWFAPNVAAVLSAFASAGFRIQLTHRWADRAAFAATVNQTPEYQEINCYERNYDSIKKSLRQRR